MKHILSRTLLVLALASIGSCSKELDFDKAEDINFNFGVNFPILDATIDLSTIIDSNETILVDPDGGLRIQFTEDDIFEFGIQDFTNIPDQELFNEDLLIGNGSIPLVAPLDNVGDFSVNEFTFESGKFIFKAISTSPDPITLEIKINNGTNNGSPAVFNFTTTGLVTTASFDLINFVMDFSGPNGANNLDIEFSSTASGFPLGSSVNLSCEAKSIELLDIKGDFGHLEIPIPEDSFSMELDGLDKFVNGLVFENPEFNLHLENEFGFDLGLNIEMKGTSVNGNTSDLNVDELIINSPTVSGDIIKETLSINKSNSNLPNFLSSLPQNLTYGGQVKLNPGAAPYSNFLHKDSKCKGSVEVNIPLEVRLTDLIYETIIEDVEVLDKESDEINNIELIFETANLFPFQADINMYMLDPLNQVLDSIPLDILKAAPVGSDGISTQANVHQFSVFLTAQNIEHLRSTNHLKFIGHLVSTNGGNTMVKIIDSYSIGIKMAVKGDGSVNNTQTN